MKDIFVALVGSPVLATIIAKINLESRFASKAAYAEEGNKIKDMKKVIKALGKCSMA